MKKSETASTRYSFILSSWIQPRNGNYYAYTMRVLAKVFFLFKGSLPLFTLVCFKCLSKPYEVQSCTLSDLNSNLDKIDRNSISYAWILKKQVCWSCSSIFCFITRKSLALTLTLPLHAAKWVLVKFQYLTPWLAKFNFRRVTEKISVIVGLGYECWANKSQIQTQVSLIHWITTASGMNWQIILQTNSALKTWLKPILLV